MNRKLLKQCAAMVSIGALCLASVFLVGAQPASAATPAHKQSTAKQITSGTVNSVSFSSANTAGGLIVAYVLWHNTGSVALTDTRNSYTPVAPATRFSNNQWSSQVFYAKNIGAGSNTVTATFGTAITAWAMVYIHEYSGIDKVSPLDGFSTATGNSSAMNSGSATVTGTNDLIFAGGASNNSVITAGSGFTTRSTLSGDRTMDKIVTSAGSYNATATQNGNVWVLHMVAFKADNTGTPPSADTTPPLVSTTSPADGATVAGTVTVSATASDNVAVKSVEFFADAVSMSVDLTSPYSHSLDTTALSEGSHTITSKAYDTANPANVGSAIAVTIIVDNIPEADTTPPVRSNGTPSGTLPSATVSATLSLVTSELANCRYATAAGTSYAAMTGVFSTTGSLNHAATVFGLTDGQSYSYYVRCQDTSGNQNPDDYTIAFAIAATQPPAGFAYERVTVDPVTEPQPWMKSIGDLNGDNVADLIVSGENGRVVWYETPNWTKRVIAQSASSQSGSAAGDIDSDGDVDVIVGTTWHENLGNGSSWAPHALPNGGYGITHDIVLADVNNDGKQDISMRGESSSTIYVYLQTNPTTWTRFIVEPGTGLNGLDVADVNGDGRRDLVVGGKWMENPGGAIATTAWPAHTFGSWNGYAAVKVININGGLTDIVLSVSEQVGKLSWFEQVSNGSWTEHIVDIGLSSVHGFVVSDIDHDGLQDIVSSEYYGQGRLTIYRQVRDPAGAITWQFNLIGTDNLHNIQAADLNGDCKLDFFGAFSLSASTPVILYRSTGGSACGM